MVSPKILAAATTLLLLSGISCFAQTVTVANEVTLGEQYFQLGDQMAREFDFGQADTWVTDDFEFISQPLDVGFSLRSVSPDDVLDQNSFSSFPSFPLGDAFPVGEKAYIGFVTKVVEDSFRPFESIGWMHLERTDDGVLRLLGSATNYGPLDPDGGRGAASGITVGMVPEPASLGLLFTAICTLGVFRRGRSSRRQKFFLSNRLTSVMW